MSKTMTPSERFKLYLRLGGKMVESYSVSPHPLSPKRANIFLRNDYLSVTATELDSFIAELKAIRDGMIT